MISFLSVRLLQRFALVVTASQFGKLVISPTQSDGVSELCAIVAGHTNETMEIESSNNMVS